MEKLKTKFRRLKYRFTRGMTTNRVLVLVFVGCCLAWTYGATASLSRNWQLEQRLVAKQRELKLLELEVDTVELENEYYASEEYQELSARSKENKLFPGEALVYLPKNSDDAKKKHKDAEVKISYTEPSNFRQWLSFLFGI